MSCGLNHSTVVAANRNRSYTIITTTTNFNVHIFECVMTIKQQVPCMHATNQFALNGLLLKMCVCRMQPILLHFCCVETTI